MCPGPRPYDEVVAERRHVGGQGQVAQVLGHVWRPHERQAL